MKIIEIFMLVLVAFAVKNLEIRVFFEYNHRFQRITIRNIGI